MSESVEIKRSYVTDEDGGSLIRCAKFFQGGQCIGVSYGCSSCERLVTEGQGKMCSRCGKKRMCEWCVAKREDDQNMLICNTCLRNDYKELRQDLAKIAECNDEEEDEQPRRKR